MEPQGQYQNQIPALSSLDVKRYERIFKVFKDSVDDKEFYHYNILKKLEFPELDESVIGYHKVQARTALSIISYDIYGDIESWWIIYLLNKEHFNGVPFWVEGGVNLKYILPGVLGSLYYDITKSTIFNGRHF
jgi:hypothetical protein